DAPAAAPPPRWSGTEPIRGGRPVARLAEGAATSDSAGVSRATWRRKLTPGERAEWDFVLPLYPLAPGTHAPARPHDALVAEARGRWRERLERAGVVRCGRPAYDALERASLVTLLVCEERSGAHLVPIGNPFQYRDVWLRDGARAVRALALAGQRDLA